MQIGVYLSDIHLNRIFVNWLKLKGKNCKALDRNFIEFNYGIFDLEKLKHLKEYISNFSIIILDFNSKNFRFIYTLYKHNLYTGDLIFLINSSHFSNLLSKSDFFIYIYDINNIIKMTHILKKKPTEYLKILEEILVDFPFLKYIPHTNFKIS